MPSGSVSYTHLDVYKRQIYDDQLLDDMPCSDKAAYRATMRRLIEEVDAKVVFGGHGEPFDGARMREIAREYLENGSGL